MADLRLLVTAFPETQLMLSLTNNRFMGAMTNNGRKLANFAGFYK